MASLPINLLVERRRCVVIGRGAIDDGKVQILESRGADVVVISEDASDEVSALARDRRVSWERRSYATGDVLGAFLVVVGSDPATNERVWRDALAAGVLVNAVDDPAHCTAIFPAIVRRGSLQVAISTDGRSPAVAVRTKARIESEFGDEYATLLDILGEARPLVSGRGTKDQRSKLWYDVLDSGILDLIRDGRVEDARSRVRELIAAFPP
jgi:siroheme synthase-like protein